MSKKVPLSIIILAKNEKNRIQECIESVYNWADEIIVIDDESTDNTREIAQKYTDKIFTRKMDLEGKQRNFGVSKARNKWVMMIDCDERMTPELEGEITSVLKIEDPKDVIAYWIPQTNYLGQYRLEHGGWSNPHVKLYHKDYLQWRERAEDVVHPGIIIKEGYRGINLKHPLIHYNFNNLEHFISKTNRYSTLEAIKWYLDKRKMGLGRALWRCVDRFFRRYIGKKGYKDGYVGFIAAVLSAFHELASYSKLREIKTYGTYLKEYGVEPHKEA